ncbi:MAG: matrixin family metalloprotease [Actinobacteria bacterium]|nr:matrixin family metalloprotease [Actinomycetota bacterium]
MLLPIATANAAATTIQYVGASWDHDPVTVYITLDKGVDASYGNEVRTVLEDWSSSLKSKSKTISGTAGAFNFSTLSSPQSKKIPADITIRIRKNTGNILGSAQIFSSNETMAYVKIVMASQNAMGKPLDKADFRNILRHELGHALGLGHANDDGVGEKDLMYPSYDYIQIGTDTLPSEIDLSAVINLYTLDGFTLPNLHPIPTSYP